MVLTDLLLLACLATFQIQPKPTGGGTLLYQLVISNYSAEVPSSQVTLAYVKLTKADQHGL